MSTTMVHSPLAVVRSGVEAMAALQDCLQEMAAREALLRSQLEEHVVANEKVRAPHQHAEAATSNLPQNENVVTAETPTSTTVEPVNAASDSGEVSHRQAREERVRHDAEVSALRAVHSTQLGDLAREHGDAMRALQAEVDAMRAQLVQAQRAAGCMVRGAWYA